MASLDMTLDDMIKSRRNSERSHKSRGRGRPLRGRGASGSFRGGRRAGAPPGRGALGVNARPSAHTIAKSFRRVKTLPWQNSLFEDGLRAAGVSSGFENGTKLYVSNLHHNVTNEDIRELFSEIGELVRYAIHYDKNGRQSGSAEVVFVRRTDAIQALKKYNNVQLDGKPMKIEVVPTNPQVPLLPLVNVVGMKNGKRTVVMNRGQGSVRPRRTGAPLATNWGSGQRDQGGRGGRGRAAAAGRGRAAGGGRGRGGSRKKGSVVTSADELDKELDSYHAESMQT
ncbi:unnamed protein product [Cuscuta epithymum]|uniref:RRM domain-containing protein n=1 Tax=Cuscuta epithymum TaxID=186058 RepID=A0AAV0ET00_9ASTE|nr:unnamed protein product [Cuscuta epithymum]